MAALGAGLTCALAASVVTAQAPIDALDPKPVMMLLVDTSGSMERMPNTELSTDALPNCAARDKNRWSITLESLTGTFTDFGCNPEDRGSYSRNAYDYGYFLQHFRPTFTGQSPTGVLDVYLNRTSFGLMTFDAVGTYTDGPMFVPYASLNANDPDRQNARGMYSFGDVGRLVFPGCPTAYGIDNGVRNDTAPSGRLVAPEVSENLANLRNINQVIQEALVGTPDEGHEDGVRPYGGTPIAPMLADLVHFIQNDALNADHDEYYSCRKRAALLITDGVPDSDFRDDRFNCQGDDAECQASAGENCSCPYDRAEDYAVQLCPPRTGGGCQERAPLNQGLHVVALSLSGDSEAVETLNLLAEMGGTEQALLADDAAELVAALAEVMNRTSTDATARTTPVVQVSGVNRQYELKAGFSIPEEDGAWTGMLTRRRWECEGITPVLREASNDEGTAKDLLHEYLDEEQSNRDVRVVTVPYPDAFGIIQGPYVDDVDSQGYAGDTLNRAGLTGNPVPTDSSGRSNYGATTVDDEEPTPLVALQNADRDAALGAIEDLDGDGDVDGDDYAYAVEWLAGEVDRDSKLGAIYHSQPVVVGPVPGDTTNNALNGFLDALSTQPETVVVATTDGLLHAFSLETETLPATTADNALEASLGLDDDDLDVPQVDPGEELWAIAPPAALANVPSATSSAQLLFDGSPIVRNVNLKQATGAAAASGLYRRVMIAALRGLAAFVAFDITNITQPKFLWQFSDPMLGETVGQPALAQLRVEWNDGEVYDRAVALFPGGSGEISSDPCDEGGLEVAGDDKSERDADQFRCWRHRGRYLYAVDVATGSLLQKFDHNFFAAPLTGGIAVDSTNLGVNASAAYLTDDDGVLYRIDFSSSVPAEWKVQAVYDVFHDTTTGGRTANYPPLLQQNEAGDWVILLGTGDVDNVTDSVAHRVVSLTERLRFDSDGSFNRAEMSTNWLLELEEGESVTGRPVLFDNTLYFASFVSQASDDPCELGDSRIWGLDYQQTDGGEDAVGRLIDLDDESITDVEFYDKNDLGYLAGNLLLGVSINQQPTCVLAEVDTDSYLGERYVPSGAVGGGTFSLRAMLGGGSGAEADASGIPEETLAIQQPDLSATRLPGGFGTVLE